MWEALTWYLKARIAIGSAFVVLALIMWLLYGVFYVIGEEKKKGNRK